MVYATECLFNDVLLIFCNLCYIIVLFLIIAFLVTMSILCIKWDGILRGLGLDSKICYNLLKFILLKYLIN